MKSHCRVPLGVSVPLNNILVNWSIFIKLGMRIMQRDDTLPILFNFKIAVIWDVGQWSLKAETEVCESNIKFKKSWTSIKELEFSRIYKQLIISG
jgi:hypothetical protein